jgi:hypothetical protein
MPVDILCTQKQALVQLSLQLQFQHAQFMSYLHDMLRSHEDHHQVCVSAHGYSDHELHK